MRIGIYNPRVGTAESGGTETFLREMVKRLAPKHGITIFTGTGEIHNEISRVDVEVRQIPFVRKEDRATQFLSSYTPVLPAEVESTTMFIGGIRSGLFDRIDRTMDVVSTHYYLDNLLVSRALNTPTIFRFPGIKHPSIRWKIMARFADPTLYLSNSESTRDRIERWLDITVSGTVHAGVDTSQFSPDAEPAFEEEAPSILFVGRLDEGKGLRDLVDAVAELEGIATHLVGSGTLRRELEERVTDHGISERVVFHGAVPHQKVHQYYAAADVFCLPSYHEGFPVVNMEAMAAGCAVVSTTIDSIREQIDHGVHGLLVTPGDITALRDALSCVVNNDDFRERLQSNALARSREFTWDSQAEALEEYYRTAARQ